MFIKFILNKPYKHIIRGDDNMQLAVGLLIPFLGTALGSAMVFLMKNKMNRKFEKLLFLGFVLMMVLDVALG